MLGTELKLVVLEGVDKSTPCAHIVVSNLQLPYSLLLLLLSYQKPGQDPSIQSKSRSMSTSMAKMDILDAPLYAFGFEFDEMSAHRVSGHLPITSKCCQPFKMLHGGVSATIAEALASIGAHIASGFQRVAGIHLSINHLKSAREGDFVVAEATPVSIGKSIQVWEVRVMKCDPSNSENKTLVSSSQVTVRCGLPVPEDKSDAVQNLRKYAKL